MAYYNYGQIPQVYQQIPAQQAQPIQQQPVIQMPQMPTISQYAQPSIIWVSSEKEAQMYPVAPNNAVTLWNTNEPTVYLKQADASGRPTIKTYDLVERTEVAAKKETTTSGGFATKDDLAAVVSAIQSVNGSIAAMKTDIDTVKNDLYGVVGKKKTTKKQEVDDDA